LIIPLYERKSYWHTPTQMGTICTVDTLRIISDDKSLALFNMVTFALSRDTDLAMTGLGMTKRQYYSRMNRLIKVGLVLRKRGKYLLTSFGRVVYESLILVEQAIEDYWRLNVIDSIERISDNDIPIRERVKIVESLIDRKKITRILLNYNIPSVRKRQVIGTGANKF
jgi:hypothetical protein